eukprot:m.28971 g.28971  ORF g.28971 m.28971 type:complete len:268 (+) comp6622_c0_seq1:58-861(+)
MATEQQKPKETAMDASRVKQMLLVCTHLGVVLSAALVLGQLTPWAWHRRCMILFLAANAHRTFERRGAQFSLSNAFLASVMAEDSFHYVIYAVIFYGEQPSVISAAPPAIYSFFKMLLGAAKLYPSIEPKIGNFIKGKGGEQQADGTIALTRSDQGFRMVATFEIMLLGVMWSRAIMYFGMRALMSAFMYSQFAMLRYTSLRNPRPRQAWAGLRQQVSVLVASPYCPSIVARVVNTIQTTVDKAVVAMQDQAQAYAQRQTNQQAPGQ